MTVSAAIPAVTRELSCDLCGIRLSLQAEGQSDELSKGSASGGLSGTVPRPRCLSCRLAISMWEYGGDGDLPRA